MSLLACVAEVLSRARMPYVVYRHPPAYTAQEQAAVSHIQGLSAVKVVICFADGQPVQVVVPAPYLVDLERLRLAAGAAECRLATEPEIATLYPQFEVGAAPPLGSLYGHRVFMEQCFVGDPEMVFNAGTHTESIGMHYGDLAELVRPVVGSFGVPPRSTRKAPTVRKLRPSMRGASPPLAGV
jgi:Ala-tRNA(Pro) deacylase